MKKYESGAFAFLFGFGLILFSNAQLFLIAPLWIGFLISATFQVFDFINFFKKR
jgi:hypothetical protein